MAEKSWESDPAIKLQRMEERSCECGAAGSGEGHTDWCKAKKFDRIPKNMSAETALKRIETGRIK